MMKTRRITEEEFKEAVRSRCTHVAVLPGMVLRPSQEPTTITPKLLDRMVKTLPTRIVLPVREVPTWPATAEMPPRQVEYREVIIRRCRPETQEYFIEVEKKQFWVTRIDILREGFLDQFYPIYGIITGTI